MNIEGVNVGSKSPAALAGEGTGSEDENLTPGFYLAYDPMTGQTKANGWLPSWRRTERHTGYSPDADPFTSPHMGVRGIGVGRSTGGRLRIPTKVLDRQIKAGVSSWKSAPWPDRDR